MSEPEKLESAGARELFGLAAFENYDRVRLRSPPRCRNLALTFSSENAGARAIRRIDDWIPVPVWDCWERYLDLYVGHIENHMKVFLVPRKPSDREGRELGRSVVPVWFV